MSHSKGDIVGILRRTHVFLRSNAHAIREQPRSWILSRGALRHGGCPAPQPAFVGTLEKEYTGHDPGLDDEIPTPNPTFTQEHAWNGEREVVRAFAGSGV
jgi:hypothetical protein